MKKVLIALSLCSVIVQNAQAKNSFIKKEKTSAYQKSSASAQRFCDGLKNSSHAYGKCVALAELGRNLGPHDTYTYNSNLAKIEKSPAGALNGYNGQQIVAASRKEVREYPSSWLSDGTYSNRHTKAVLENKNNEEFNRGYQDGFKYGSKGLLGITND